MKLIHFYDDIDQWELYDLQTDPHELHNRMDDPACAGVRQELFDELVGLQKQYQDTLALRRNASFPAGQQPRQSTFPNEL